MEEFENKAPKKVKFDMDSNYSSSEVVGSINGGQNDRSKNIQDSGVKSKEQENRERLMDEMIERAQVAQFKQTSEKIRNKTFYYQQNQPKEKVFMQSGNQLKQFNSIVEGVGNTNKQFLIKPQ